MRQGERLRAVFSGCKTHTAFKVSSSRPAATRPLHRGARGIGVEAFFVEEEDAGAEGEEHDGEAGSDTEAGGDRRGTIVAAAHDDVARNGDQEIQNAAPEQPGDEPGDHGGGVAEIEIKEDGPEQPSGAPKKDDIRFLVEKLFPKIVATNGETQGPNYGGEKKGGEKRADGDRNENVGAGLETFERRIDGKKE